MGVLRWLRGGDDTAPGTASGGAALDAIGDLFSPGRERAREDLHSLSLRKDDEGDGTAREEKHQPYRLDFDGRTAVLRHRSEEPDDKE